MIPILAAAETPPAPSVAPLLYAQLLQRYVVPAAGEGEAAESRFDYARFHAWEGQEEFRRGLRVTFLSVDPGALDAETRVVWAINTYNFLVIDLVTENFLPADEDTLASIGDIGEGGFAVFDQELFTVVGNAYSLNSFERHFLFLDPDRDAGKVSPDLDPRLHFALVCAAKGCPPLLADAYRPAQLEMQIDAVTRQALRSARHLQVADGRVRTGQVFAWYAADFQHVDGGIPGFLREYGPGGLPEEAFEPAADIEWDWSLNRP